MNTEATKKTLRIAFIHPDLGIGGAERLVVDAALGLQKLGHTVEIHTSHHDPEHCFDETRDGTLKVINHQPPVFLPRTLLGKLHILFAHLRQLHLTFQLVQQMNRTKKPKRKVRRANPDAEPTENQPPIQAIEGQPTKESEQVAEVKEEQEIDIFFIDQLSTCIPILRFLTARRVVFYCHFPDKLLASGEFIDDHLSGTSSKSATHQKQTSWLKKLYRLPMDGLEEYTTGKSDLILANSMFTARVFKRHLPSIRLDKDGFRVKELVEGGRPRIVYPGINLQEYGQVSTTDDDEIKELKSERPTFVSLNRFEAKKNLPLALHSFSTFINNLSKSAKDKGLKNARLVLAGGYDPRVKENIDTLNSLLVQIQDLKLTWHLLTSASSVFGSLPSAFRSQDLLDLRTSASVAQVILLPNFSTVQRSLLLTSKSTLALLYTPQNEHFGIVPVEAGACGLPVLACDSGGPTESIVDDNNGEESPGGGWSVVDLKEKDSKRTGWLRPPQPDVWANAMYQIATLSPSTRTSLTTRAKARAQSLFSMDAMSYGLETALFEAFSLGPVTTFHDIKLAIRTAASYVGWTFAVLVFLTWIVLGVWVLFGTEGSIILCIGLFTLGLWRGWWSAILGYLKEVRYGPDKKDKPEEEKPAAIEAAK